MGITFVNKVCSLCGSEEVHADAYADWDYIAQKWELHSTFYKGAYCEKCDGDCRIEDKELDGEALIEARANRIAREHGWLPSDEDTAIEFCEDEGLDYELPK